jgi:hypothetical protein
MSDSTSKGTPVVAKIPAKRSRFRWGYSLGAMFAVLTAFCFYQAYRTNQQILKYYTPAPAVDYNPHVESYDFTDADFVNPIDPRPATVQLLERVQVITNRIGELRARGDAKSAVDIQARLDQVMANREGPYPVDGTLQLHAIGIYDGGDPKNEVNQIDGHDVGDSHVRITYQGGPIIVCLCAYDPVRWILEVEPGVNVKKVIVAGYYQQQVEGLPDEIPIEGQTAGRNRQYAFYADTPFQVPNAAMRLRELSGQDPTTFYTTHEYEGTPFVIGPGGAEWTAMMTLRALDPLFQEAVREKRMKLAAELVAHSFPDIACVGEHRFGSFQCSFATHSVFGPYAETMQPLSQSAVQFAIDPRGPSFFGWHNGLVTIDPTSGTATPWPVPGIEGHTGDTRLAFDTKRNRLLLWDRELMAIDILQKRADLVCHGYQDVRAFTYSPTDDKLYACCAPYDGNSGYFVTELRTYTHRGAELSRTKLSAPIPAEKLKVSLVGGNLLVTALEGRDGSGSYPLDTNYIIEPHTGKLLFACRRKPR